MLTIVLQLFVLGKLMPLFVEKYALIVYVYITRVYNTGITKLSSKSVRVVDIYQLVVLFWSYCGDMLSCYILLSSCVIRKLCSW